MVNIPAGSLPPGTTVQVGEHLVTVERFLSEGGFAHVYLVRSSKPIKGHTSHVLKRVAVPDKESLKVVRREVDVMKALRNHPKIVSFIEATASNLPHSNGYEVFILMEFCPGGGIIDMLNTRLQNRLTEFEILKIFSDTVEAVAYMHYQSPPLIHLDLKVENILLAPGPPQTFKLCDFGSTRSPLQQSPSSVPELQSLELEINRTTTLQYRAPELVDVWRRGGMAEPVDIWALGVLLYKLCYYTTPFEEHGPLAILNVQYKFPPFPAYSNEIRSLISTMLQEHPIARPNIYQVHERVCQLRGVPVRLENKYAVSDTKFTRTSKPTQHPVKPVPNDLSNILTAAPTPLPDTSTLVDSIHPMRRGRPQAAAGTNQSFLTGKDSVSHFPKTETRAVRTGISSANPGKQPWEVDKPPTQPSLSMSAQFDDTFGITSSSTSKTHSTGLDPKLTPSSQHLTAPPTGNNRLSPSVTGQSMAPSPSITGWSLKESPDVGSTTTRFTYTGETNKGDSPPTTKPKLTNNKTAVGSESDFISRFPALDLSSFSTPVNISNSPGLPLGAGTNASSGGLPPGAGYVGSKRNVFEKISNPQTSTLSPPVKSALDPKTAASSSSEERVPPLPRRPPVNDDLSKPNRPKLTDKSSQTSPHLLAALLPQAQEAARKSAESTSSRPPATSQPLKETWRHETGKTASVAVPFKVPKPSGAFDLLTDGDEGPRSFSLKPTVTSSTSPLTSMDTANKRRSMPPMSTSGRPQFRPAKATPDHTSTSPDMRTIRPRGHTHLFNQIHGATNEWDKSQEADKDDSSDQEMYVKRKNPHQSSRPSSTSTSNQGVSTRSTLSESGSDGGRIDIGPALASIAKFAPSSESRPPPRDQSSPDTGPEDASGNNRKRLSKMTLRPITTGRPIPITAPKPVSAKSTNAITNLVSQYDHISSSPTSPTSSTASLSRKPVPVPSKPAKLRGNSVVLSEKYSPKSTHTELEDFADRFPDLNDAKGSQSSQTVGKKSGAAVQQQTQTWTGSSLPMKAVDRQPFKPAKIGSPLRNPSSGSPMNLTSPATGEEEEQPFQGVSKMVSRWQSATTTQKPHDTGPSDSRSRVRQEWVK